MDQVKNGVLARDIVTGYSGIVWAITHHLNGCVRVALKGKMRDGKVPEAELFDIQQVEVVDSGVTDWLAEHVVLDFRESPITLGCKVKDRITGFTGIVTSVTEFVAGWVQLAVSAPSLDGKPGEVDYVDVQMVEYIDEGVRSKLGLDEEPEDFGDENPTSAAARPGGDQKGPTKIGLVKL